jgi:hypothetical protein
MVVSGQLHTTATLHPRNNWQYRLVRRLGEPQSRSGHCGEDKNPAMSGKEPLSSCVLSVIILTEMPQLAFIILCLTAGNVQTKCDCLQTGKPRFDSQYGRIFFFAIKCRPTLGSSALLFEAYRDYFVGTIAAGVWTNYVNLRFLTSFVLKTVLVRSSVALRLAEEPLRAC